MKKLILLFLLPLASFSCARAQRTFKAGWNTYTIGMIIHEYTYSCTIEDSVRLSMSDSAQILCSTDSSVVVAINYRIRDNSSNKTIHYFGPKKQVTKTEEYKGENLVMVHEWKYDDRNRKASYIEDNKASGKSYRKTYDYSTDKKNGDLIVTEASYYNGRVEFYTKSYYDKKNVKYKEVRLNDNNRDVVHIESYTYGANGKVKERSVYFPEFKVTKKFTENVPDDIPKCAKTTAMNTADKIHLPGAIYLRNFVRKMQTQLSDPECTQFEYRFVNHTNEIVVCTTKTNSKQVVLRSKERF